MPSKRNARNDSRESYSLDRTYDPEEDPHRFSVFARTRENVAAQEGTSSNGSNVDVSMSSRRLRGRPSYVSCLDPHADDDLNIDSLSPNMLPRAHSHFELSPLGSPVRSSSQGPSIDSFQLESVVTGSGPVLASEAKISVPPAALHDEAKAHHSLTDLLDKVNLPQSSKSKYKDTRDESWNRHQDVRYWFLVSKLRHVFSAALFLHVLLMFVWTSNSEWMERIPVWIVVVETILLVVYAVEVLLKASISGFRTYFNDSVWNVYDFFVLVGCWLSFFIISAPHHDEDDWWQQKHGNNIVGVFLTFRMLRLLPLFNRPRRMLTFIGGVIGEVYWVLLSVMFIFWAFAIVGVFAFGNEDPEQFGTVDKSAFTLTTVIFAHNYKGALAPVKKIYPSAWLYFVIFMLVFDLFLLDLVLAILVEAFNAEERSHLLKIKRNLKDALIQKKREHEEVVELKELIMQILNAVPDPVFVKDSRFRYILVNDAFRKLFRITRKEIYGRRTNQLPVELSSQLSLLDVDDDRVLLDGAVWEHEDLVNVRDEHGALQPLFLNTRKNMLHVGKSVDGETRYIVGITRNITVLKQQQEEIEFDEKLLEDAKREMDELFAMERTGRIQSLAGVERERALSQHEQLIQRWRERYTNRPHHHDASDHDASDHDHHD